MTRYYVNKNAQPISKDHEVHRPGCTRFPSQVNAEFLGDFLSCHGAVQEAKRKHPGWRVNGCFYCSRDCHTS